MNAKQKYNSIIQAIEDGARNPNFSVSEIMDKVLKQSGMGVRELNSVMTFLTENTLRSYIVYRKMMASYLYIFETDEFDVDKAVAISGYDNQSSFTKAFTNIFEMAPKETFNSNKESLYKEPLIWDCISDDIVSQINIAKETQPLKKETIFGMNPEQYARVLEASELQELYGFDRIYSQVAYDVSMHWKIPLKDAFEYMESWRTFIEEDYTVVDPLCAYTWLSKKPGSIQNEPNFEEILRCDYAFNDEIKYLYFSAGMSVTLCILTLWRLVGTQEDITHIDPLFMYEYAQTTNFSFDIFMECCQYFEDNKNEKYKYSFEDFDEYIDNICRGLTKEEAFEEVIPIDCIIEHEYDIDLMEEEDDLFGSYEEEEELKQWNWEPWEDRDQEDDLDDEEDDD